MGRNTFTKTPEMVLDDFKRYIRSENSRRKGAFGLNFDTDEGRRFVEQIQKLKDLENLQTGTGNLPVPLSQEVLFPEELSDQQILYYFSRRPYFAEGILQAGEEFYGRLYMLELANELHHSSPGEALLAVYGFYDALEGICSHPGNPDYLLRLSMSVLIAHSELAEEIREGLIKRDLYWQYDLVGEIRQGRFMRAGLFVKKYARLLKQEEIDGEKPFIKATWEAMPFVFSSLDETFGDNSGHLFRRFLTAGEESSRTIELLPVRRRAFGLKRRISLSDTCYLDSHPSYGSIHKEEWVRTEWVLREGAGDFLYLIHLYTESYVREYFKAPKRKRTAARFLKKKYARTGDDRDVIRAMKEVMKDDRFEEAIGSGVAACISRHPRPDMAGGSKKKTKKERQAELIYQMDHEQPAAYSGIDYERLKQAKSDAESVLSMLHNEEIDYNK